MPTFEQFSHSEVSTTLRDKLPDTLRYDKRIRDEGKLIRLLIGATELTENISGITFRQGKNLSILPATGSRASKRLFYGFLGAGYDINHIDNYLKQSAPANTVFYRELLNEFSCYFYNSHRQAYTLAFLNLYRILEHISYSFPLVFAGRAKDFKGTFTKLQDFFHGTKSELKFFDHFVKDLFDATTLDAHLTINVTAPNNAIREKYFKVLKRICHETKEVTLHNETEFSEIEIDYKSFTHLIISLRNRYFHFLSGSNQNNISSKEVIDPDSFFKCLCEDFANWLAVIYFEIVKSDIER